MDIKNPKDRFAQMSKSILKNSSVQECLYAPDQGFDEYYKYDVFLKTGHVFTNGKYFGLRSGRFRTVKDFREACAMAIDDIPKSWYNCPIRNEYGNDISHE